MEHILDIEREEAKLYPIFKKIQESNTILFLGAGASVGEKKYLSKELIAYYEDKININLGESNITKWIDILSANPSFNRSNFDKLVADILKKISFTEAHKIMASIPWREIITTNYDLLVEQAFDEIANTSLREYELKIIRNTQQYSYKESNNEVRYIKLNGCIQDKSQYPLAFSSDDFNNLKPFYKRVLNDLKNLSPDISFISIGYSYSDDFGKDLLSKFDSYNYREKKWMINIDPYPNLNALSYYTTQKIQIIQCSFSDFFEKYQKWYENNASVLIKKKGLSIRSSNDTQLSLPSKLLLNLDGIVKQLNTHTRDNYYIKDEEFYKGEEPTFNIITRDVDVVKSRCLDQFKKKINDVILKKETFLPIFFIIGDFGIGKSTFSLRLIYEMQKELDLVCFTIEDFNRLKKEYIIDLVKLSNTKNVVFYCEDIEIESYFKGLINLRSDLSIEQIQDCNIFFIGSIRENMLEKYKTTRLIPCTHELKIDGAFEANEVEELLDKLKSAGLVSFRDFAEKNTIKNKVLNDYNSDSFVSLMSIVSGGKHESDLIDCYNQLSKDAQKAFIYTALLHRFKFSIPAAWLKQNIAMDWDEFITKVVKVEGKGILIQEIRSSHGTQPDLYFKTKHPIIAEKLINKFVKSKDKQFELYERMLRAIEISVTNSYLVNNLLKTFIRNDIFNKHQIDKLFLAAYSKLSDDPYFLLNYATNLQHKNTISSIKKAINILIYAESLLDSRNHKFIHRRAVLNYDLSKLYFKEENFNLTSFYLNESKELFNTKQLLDPCSSYSYVDYIKCLIWELVNYTSENEERMYLQIKIEALFEYASTTVTLGVDKIDALYTEYANYLSLSSNNHEYEVYLLEMYDKERLRPLACILLYNYNFKKNNYEKCNAYIEEIEFYKDNYEVAKFLLNFYGELLYDPNIRVKLLKLVSDNNTLETDMPFRYNFFIFIAEFYNNNYREGGKYLERLRTKYNLNPALHYIWCDCEGREEIFDAKITQDHKYKQIKIKKHQLKTRLIKGNYDKYQIGADVKVRLHFYLYGLFAEIVN